mmetsp:Transcript_24615/g.70688  ORF Transcript_24615/g.70688 Transcript_24615/m.70688 type:complete len:95 (+) Transcript_24615:94-378(+)
MQFRQGRSLAVGLVVAACQTVSDCAQPTRALPHSRCRYFEAIGRRARGLLRFGSRALGCSQVASVARQLDRGKMPPVSASLAAAKMFSYRAVCR